MEVWIRPGNSLHARCTRLPEIQQHGPKCDGSVQICGSSEGPNRSNADWVRQWNGVVLDFMFKWTKKCVELEVLGVLAAIVPPVCAIC